MLIASERAQCSQALGPNAKKLHVVHQVGGGGDKELGQVKEPQGKERQVQVRLCKASIEQSKVTGEMNKAMMR